MTDPESSPEVPWVALLHEAAQRSGHELRNALNGLMVNVEVVRAAPEVGERDAPLLATFLSQAAIQADQSARLADATLALLELVLGAIDHDGSLQGEAVSPHSVRLAARHSDLERTVRRLQALGERAGVQTEAGDSAVILTVRSESSADPI